MPGVPSGKGCENCRKQKKKCDETKPSCSRCLRLHLVCVGSGQKRYQFKGPQFFRKRRHEGQTTLSCTSGNETYLVSKPAFIPSNEMDLVVISFVDAIKESTDMRFNLAWNYGDFLGDAVQRLGTNEALDASVKALVTAHAAFCTHQDDLTTPLVQYSNALKKLRKCLDDPIKACDVNTLCAVMVLLICQSLNGAEGLRWTGHCEGAAQILKSRGIYNPDDAFERKLLLTVRAPVLFESILNDKIEFSTEEWRILVDANFRDSTPEDDMMRCVAHLRDYLYRRRNRRGQCSYVTHNEDLLTHYQTMKNILTAQRERLNVFETNRSTSSKKTLVTRLQWAYQSAYGIGLVVAIAYNCVLCALHPENIELILDSGSFVADVLILAKDACRCKPLGSSYIALCLGAAWVGTEDPSTKVTVESAWIEYGGDFAPGLQKPPIGELEWTSRQLRLLD